MFRMKRENRKDQSTNFAVHKISTNFSSQICCKIPRELVETQSSKQEFSVHLRARRAVAGNPFFGRHLSSSFLTIGNTGIASDFETQRETSSST